MVRPIRVHMAKQRIIAYRHANRNFQNWIAKGKNETEYQDLWDKRDNISIIQISEKNWYNDSQE